MFGFTSKASIDWIVPIIDTALYLPKIFLNFQNILMYIPMGYRNHAASVLAGNDIFTFAIAAIFPYVDPFDLFLTGSDIIMFQAFRSCILPGSALLAGISFLLMPVFFVCNACVSSLPFTDYPSLHSFFINSDTL